MSSFTSLINRNLSTSLVNDIYRQLSDNIIYISSESVKSIEQFIEKSEDESNKKVDTTTLKKLWKNIIIDAISFLKINDSREKLYYSFQEILTGIDDKADLYKKFRKHFDDIRNFSSFGIEELSSYLDDFIEFESVLYGSLDTYRDHVEHVINVWAIGVGILADNACKFNISGNVSVYDDDFVFNYEGRESNSKSEQLFISKGEILSIWTIIALCHDLGYPLEKATSINRKTNKIIQYFGSIEINEYKYHFSLFNNYLTEKFLNIVSSKHRITPKNGSDGDFNYYTSVQSKYRDKISKSLEENRHGVFSSLLIFKTLTFFLETDFSNEKDSLSKEDLRQFCIRKEILRAICAHTCPKIYHIELNNLIFLLILCDELQEWGRPNFEELKIGNFQNEKVEPIIKKIIFNPLESNSEIEVEMTYKKPGGYDIKNIEKEVVNKFRFFHHLLRSAKDDTDRKCKFIWKIYLKNSDATSDGYLFYRFIFDSKSAFNTIKVSRKISTEVRFKKIDIYSEEY